MQRQKIELLAPARDLACGIGAINHGADAVYIGGPKFSARAAAGNTLVDIAKLVGHAHQFRARVYVALNTLFNDQELESAVKLCCQLHEIGVDALIIQDVGLLESDLPSIPLHSSTQMNNQTVAKVVFLEKIGFQQVVLARELSLERIRQIRAATTVPLEFFVHGALCVSYSGQCYISEVMAGRSANRGECAQFCRHKFTLQDKAGKIVAKDRYLLSLKDLNLSAHLGALIEAGISSFKIEGRLKDENYVKNVTASYRQALDALIDVDPGLQRASSGRCNFTFTPNPQKSFNRGMTDHFLVNPRNRSGAIESPKSIGQPLGRVVHAEKQFFQLQTKEVVNNGDGLCYFDPHKGLTGIKINRVENGRMYPKDPLEVPLGMLLYRNADTAFNKLLARSEQCRTIGLQLEVEENVDGLQLRITDEDGIASTTRIKAVKAPARQAGMVIALAEKQLRKIGGSIFSIEKVRVDLASELFFPAAVFNDLRRQGLEQHIAARRAQYPVEQVKIIVNNFPWPNAEVSYLDNITNEKAAAFYQRHGVKKIDSTALRAEDVADCALMSTKYCVRAQLQLCPKNSGRPGELAETLTLKDNTAAYALEFDCRKCAMTVKKLLPTP